MRVNSANAAAVRSVGLRPRAITGESDVSVAATVPAVAPAICRNPIEDRAGEEEPELQGGESQPIHQDGGRGREHREEASGDETGGTGGNDESAVGEEMGIAAGGRSRIERGACREVVLSEERGVFVGRSSGLGTPSGGLPRQGARRPEMG
ncbi:hypothetical protein [Stigmatella aurantiaca]|uniref:hypothetical protein n=1 Tax=Stigmatella aurantiaca TaxID=41 RepID=UPI0011D2A294|nr:hypothetical protein [Stigmatella aurantiaca]